MSQQSYIRFTESCHGKACFAMVMLLALCVIVQMLGVPVTLLNPVEMTDTLALSISEGFSVPSLLPQLTPPFETVPVTDRQPSIHVPVLTSSLFHPPVI